MRLISARLIGRGFVAALVVLVMGFLSWPERPQAQAPASFDQLFVAYSGGDVEIVSRTIRTARDLASATAGLDATVSRWRNDWRPVHAAFLVELAAACVEVSRRGWPPEVVPPETIWKVAASAGTVVMQRPVPFGRNPSDDQIEITTHRAVIGVLEGLHDTRLLGQYLTALGRRFGTTAVPDGRILLGQAMAAALVCCTQVKLADVADHPGGGRWLNAPADASNTTAPVVPGGGQSARERLDVAIDAAVKLFRDASQRVDVRVEAIVRGSTLLRLRGHAAQALAWLDDVAAPTDDSVLRYWADLARGETLDALARPADAALAYRAALGAAPDAQSARIRLALDLTRLGRGDEAVEIGRAAATAPSTAADPRWIYDDGDWRFVPDWLTSLRKAVR